MKLQQCSKCHKAKPLSDFKLKKNGVDLYKRCTFCTPRKRSKDKNVFINANGETQYLTDQMVEALCEKPSFSPKRNANEMFFRPSGVKEFATKPKAKGAIISEGAKTAARKFWIKEVFNRQEDIGSKYLEKGILQEQEAINMLNRVTGNNYIKNDELFFRNKYVNGTPDIIDVPKSLKPEESCIIDIKNSYNIFSFFKSIDSKINQTYYYQLQCYMWLTGIRQAYLVYCLVDTPGQILNDEIRRLGWKLGDIDGENPMFNELYEQIKYAGTYSDIDESLRIEIKDISYDEECIEDLIVKLDNTRKYINENFFKIKL